MIATLLLSLSLVQAGPKDAKPDYNAGRKMIDAYFREQVKDIESKCLVGYDTLAKWEKAKPELRRQLFEMLGLDPLPAKTDLKATVTGVIDAPKYTIEKMHFQSIPGLYVFGNLYVPKPRPRNGPAILYVCGHGNNVKDGVSYGSKTVYQHHAHWFAEHGYTCLIIDTLQLSEIPGIHHGTYRENMWWWQSLGYTPAGVECWNGIRALDYLETRPEVDMNRVGVTGRSGGGAYSWWIAACDDRIAAAVPVAGIADLRAHLIEGEADRYKDGVIAGHCDCMFMVNKYRWDFAQVAALIAPRPVLLGNSDKDDIFPVAGYRRLAAKLEPIYKLYGKQNNFQLLETKGPHVDTPELRLGAYKWMNKHLKGETGEVTEEPFTKRDPAELKVFKELPTDAINAKAHETFMTGFNPSKSGYSANVRLRLNALDKSWNVPGNASLSPKGLQLDKHGAGILYELDTYSLETAPHLRIDIWRHKNQLIKDTKSIILYLSPKPVIDAFLHEFAKEEAEAAKPGPGGWAIQVTAPVVWNCYMTPSGRGTRRWAAAGSKDEAMIRRRFALIGETLESVQLRDIRKTIRALLAIKEAKGAELHLKAEGDLAVLAIYAALLEPGVTKLTLTDPAPSHREGPALLGILKELDVPQALSLLQKPEVGVIFTSGGKYKPFQWIDRMQEASGWRNIEFTVVGK